jgi:hypothetical protein
MRYLLLQTILLIALTSVVDAQPSPDTPPSPSTPTVQAGSAVGAASEATQMAEMQSMAKSMTAMADTCRLMMEMEMKSWPVKVAAMAIVGPLVVIALLLFVVLEVQWIRFWRTRNAL